MRTDGVTDITLRAVEWALAIAVVALLIVVFGRTSEVAFATGFGVVVGMALGVASDEAIPINRQMARGALWVLIGVVILMTLLFF